MIFNKKDKFIHPYMGSLYINDEATEILSTGFEKFTNSKNIQKFYEQDCEHFALCLTAALGSFVIF